MKISKNGCRYKIISLAMLAALPMMIETGHASPLALPSPLTFEAGPLGKLNVQGVASGYGVWQDNKFAGSGNPGNKYASADISNGMVIIQKNTGLVQFYLQAGAYNVMSLGSNFVSTGTFTQNTFGALPVGYVEIAPTDNFNIQIGKLFTLIGAEYTYSYQNWNIERGLLWGQENAVNKGIQANYTAGPVTASVSWNDGFYSNRFNWVTGMLTWAINKQNSVFFQGGGNLGQTDYAYSSIATTPLQNNESIFDVGYTYNGSNLSVTPYMQYTSVPAGAIQALGDGTRKTSTLGAAILADYSLTDKISVAGRVEYISNSGTATDGAANLTGFGPGSHAWSLTVTPTYQDGGFFARAELSYVAATMPSNTGFSGTNSLAQTQLRGMVETGFMF
ncbi:porin [Acidithiobacillus sp.]|uniref:porin n=1 Tax=Acidithiobacillus sp. TaxID=1872118 RepID=UPI00262F3DD7|nr:porin [Acidithiobacillus sp.]